MFDELTQMLRSRLGMPVQATPMQRQATNMNSWRPRQNVNPQFQQTPGSEGTAIQGRQFDPRLNPQGALQPRLQQTYDPQRLRLQ